MNTGINRIILEFKGMIVSALEFMQGGLIESYWNLKYLILKNDKIRTGINRIILEFKGTERLRIDLPYKGLIESYWNLKESPPGTEFISQPRINRIILEFKEACPAISFRYVQD